MKLRWEGGVTTFRFSEEAGFEGVSWVMISVLTFSFVVKWEKCSVLFTPNHTLANDSYYSFRTIRKQSGLHISLEWPYLYGKSNYWALGFKSHSSETIYFAAWKYSLTLKKKKKATASYM